MEIDSKKVAKKSRSKWYLHLDDGRLLEFDNILDFRREINKLDRKEMLLVIKGRVKDLKEEVRLTV